MLLLLKNTIQNDIILILNRVGMAVKVNELDSLEERQTEKEVMAR